MKANHYSTILLDKIQEAIDEIGMDELQEGDNAKQFFYALGNLVPCQAYNTLTGKNLDVLGFNHEMNRLIFNIHTE